MAGAVVAVAATVSVFYGFPPERRGFALGMRQMSVALGGLLAALLLPLAVHLGGVRLALGLSGALTAITAVAFALYTPHGPLVPPTGCAARRGAVRGAQGAGHAPLAGSWRLLHRGAHRRADVRRAGAARRGREPGETAACCSRS